MTPTMLTSPDQILLLNDLIFDLTGLPITLGSSATFVLSAALVTLFFKSPMFNRA